MHVGDVLIGATFILIGLLFLGEGYFYRGWFERLWRPLGIEALRERMGTRNLRYAYIVSGIAMPITGVLLMLFSEISTAFYVMTFVLLLSIISGSFLLRFAEDHEQKRKTDDSEPDITDGDDAAERLSSPTPISYGADGELNGAEIEQQQQGQ